MSKLNLEELANTSSKQNEKQVENKKAKEPKKDTTPQQEVEKLYKLPFKVAMQNLNITEEDIIEAGKELLLTGKVTKKYNLPLGNYIIITSRKASEELDYYTFMADAVTKQYTVQEFDFLLRIRNLAVSIIELKLGDEVIDFRDKSIDEKYEYLLNLSAPLMSMIINATYSFWSIIMLLMHPGAIDFLTKTLQK